jgi:hypothetical protein
MATLTGRVFFNVPFDARYERLYVAMVSGLVTLGYAPRCALEIPATSDRLSRIFGLMRTCEYSLHDLSRVQLSAGAQRCPRFNMPFEAGLAYALFLTNKDKHSCAIFEGQAYRVQRSLSDLNGIDAHIHGETVRGLSIALTDLFSVPGADAEALMSVYRRVAALAKLVKTRNGNDLFRPSSYRQLVALSQGCARDAGYIP